MQAEFRDQEEARSRDMDRVRAEAEEGRKGAEERAERMRLGREALAKEIADINARLLEERIHHDEETGRIRMQLKTEENVTYHKMLKKIKSSLYSRYYAEACDEWRSLSPLLSVWATQLRRNVAAVASRWRHCVPFALLRNRTRELLR